RRPDLPAHEHVHGRAGHHAPVSGAHLVVVGGPARVRVLRRRPVQRVLGRQSALAAAPLQWTGTSAGPTLSTIGTGSPSVGADSSTNGSTTAAPAGASIYRSSEGFRPSASPQPAESAAVPAPLTVRALLDSATLALPDTAQFSFKPYRVRFTADYMVRPTVGYQRDNFGRGFFG